MKNPTATALDLARAALDAAEQEQAAAAARVEQLDAAIADAAKAYDADPSDKNGRVLLAARNDRELAAVRAGKAAERLEAARAALAEAQRDERAVRLDELLEQANRARFVAALNAPIAAILAARAAEREAREQIAKLVAAQHAAHREAQALAGELGRRVSTVAIADDLAETMLDLAELDAMALAERAAKVPHFGTRERAILRRCAIRCFGPAGFTGRHLVGQREALDMIVSGGTSFDVGRLEQSRAAAKLRQHFDEQRAAALTFDRLSGLARVAKEVREAFDELGAWPEDEPTLRAQIQTAIDDAKGAEQDAAEAEAKTLQGQNLVGGSWAPDEREKWTATYVPRSRRAGASASAKAPAVAA